MNIRQVEWAGAHDWYRYAFEEVSGDWNVCVETLLVDRDGTRAVERITFTDYKELRDWAGY